MKTEDTKFAFELGDGVGLVYSEEEGVVIGRAEYMHAPCGYYVRYVAGDGRQVKDWFNAEDLRAA